MRHVTNFFCPKNGERTKVLLYVALYLFYPLLYHLLFFSVDAKLMQGHLAAIRHARWFEENAFHSR